MSIGLNASSPGEILQLLLLHGIGILNHILQTDNRISMHYPLDAIIGTLYIEKKTTCILLNKAYNYKQIVKLSKRKYFYQTQCSEVMGCSINTVVIEEFINIKINPRRLRQA